ncbi:MAG: peptidylprolyl isomerase [Patescibacteria group bacterium]
MEKSNVSRRALILYILLIVVVGFLITFSYFSKSGALFTSNPCNITYQPSVKSYSSYPKFCINKNKTYTANIQTSYGNIKVALYPKAAPLAVNNFVFLSESGFYNNVIFTRVIKGFMDQTGSPTGQGNGGPGYKFNDQINPISLGIPQLLINAYKKQGYTYDYAVQSIPINAGTLAMANSGPNTNGSQFFITVAKEGRLNGLYTAFGKVVKGMSVVKEINNIPVNKSAHHKPLSNIYINKITISSN